jgi:hypothetical protein
MTVGFSFDDEATANSKDELTVAPSGSQDLRRRSSCNLCACSFHLAQLDHQLLKQRRRPGGVFRCPQDAGANPELSLLYATLNRRVRTQPHKGGAYLPQREGCELG